MIPQIVGCALINGPVVYAETHSEVEEDDDGTVELYTSIFALPYGSEWKDSYSLTRHVWTELQNHALHITIPSSLFKTVSENKIYRFNLHGADYSLKFYTCQTPASIDQNYQFSLDTRLSEFAQAERRKSTESILLGSPAGHFLNLLFPKEVKHYNLVNDAEIHCYQLDNNQWKLETRPLFDLYREFQEHYKEGTASLCAHEISFDPENNSVMIQTPFSKCRTRYDIRAYSTPSNLIFVHDYREYAIIPIETYLQAQKLPSESILLTHEQTTIDFDDDKNTLCIRAQIV